MNPPKFRSRADWERAFPKAAASVRTIEAAAAGARGFTRAFLRIRLAMPAVIEERRQICNSCDRLKKYPWGNHCQECSCWIERKTSLADERCPLDKWHSSAAREDLDAT
jgi:hypothetical protein